MHQERVGYLYAFDEDFDTIDDVSRLDTATIPSEADSA